MALSISTNGSISSQTNTQNPQTAGYPSGGIAETSGVQPSTAASVFTGQQDASIYNTSLPTVDLSVSSVGTRAASNPPSPRIEPKHQINPILLSFPIVLVLIAVILFWTARRSVKSTTE